MSSFPSLDVDREACENIANACASSALAGIFVGAALTLAVPRGVTSVWIRQAPFFVLGLSGIAADYYAIQSLCARESG